jgi:predicted AAA+ superfamily ATPase
MYDRLIEKRIRTAMGDTPIVAVNGPRQSGKTTLVRAIATPAWRYLTLDDQTVLEAAATNPVGFIRDLDRAIIDEIQRAPALMLALKQSVDRDRRPGRFLITGSANVLTMPKAQESLAGRIEIATLLPLCQAELASVASPGLIEALFEGRLPRQIEPRGENDALLRKVLAGGYPDVISREGENRRIAWCRQYLDAIVQRDLADLAAIERPVEIRRLVDALAIHVGQLTNFTELGGKLRLNDKTVATYVGLLEQLFIVRRLDAWHRNALKRLVKTPKLHFLDTALVAASRRLTLAKLKADRTLLGALLEGFVFAELQKLATISDEPIQFFHYRDKDQVEVDFVLENPAGDVVGVEVKASATVVAADFAGLRKLAKAAGDDFKIGILLYDGDEVLPFGDRLWAAPVSVLWAAS